jgi:hypothetical protein
VNLGWIDFQEVLLLVIGLACGAIGGLAAALSKQFNGFRTMPLTAAPHSKKLVQEQDRFFWSRVIYGAIVGFIVTLPCLQAIAHRTLEFTTLAAIQAISGMSSDVVRTLPGAVIAKLKGLY